MSVARARALPHVGRRGTALLFFCVLDLIYAMRLIMPDPESRGRAQFRWLDSVLPLWVWALIWVGVGLICGVHAFRRCDRYGFVAAISLKVMWGSLCLGGWATGHVPGGYASAAIWLAAAGFVWVIGGWPEPGGRKGPAWTRPSP